MQRQTMIDKILAIYKQYDSKQKRGILIALLVIFIISLGAAAYFIGTFYDAISGNTTNPFIMGLTHGFTVTIMIALAVTILFAWLLFGETKLNRVAGKDNDSGSRFMGDGVHGTSRWLTQEEAIADYNISDIKDTTGTVVGQFSDGGKEVVTEKPYFNNDGTEEQNNLIIGSPNTGKSYVFVRTEMIQTILRGDSLVVTDPSGELYTSLNKFCIKHGYKTFILNLTVTEHSDYWNCVWETVDSKTDRVDGMRLNEFSGTYMENAQKGKEDAFWSDGANNLLSACIGLAGFRRESFIIEQYRKLFIHITDGDPKYAYISSQMNAKKPNEEKGETHDGNISIRYCEAQILRVANEYGYNMNEVQYVINTIRDSAPPFTLKEVYDIIMNFQDYEPEFIEIPSSHPAKDHYKIFNTSQTASVRTQILQGLQMKFQLFADKNLLELLSHDGIDLSRFNSEKTACFVIMNDKTTNMKPISSLFFSFFFKDAQQAFDEAQQVAKGKGVPNPMLSVTVMLDEFFSIGVIGGDVNQFPVVMSNSRKRKLHISIILQGITQIPQLYGPENAKTIQTCCSTVIFLGCNDEDTAKFISEFLSGKATVMSESHREGSSILASATSAEVNISSTERTLLTPDEVRRWRGKMLVVKRGCLPLQLNPFPWKQHPCAIKGELEDSDYFQTIPPLGERLAQEKMMNANGTRMNSDQCETWIDNNLPQLKPMSQPVPFTTENQQYHSNYSNNSAASSKTQDTMTDTVFEFDDSDLEDMFFNNDDNHNCYDANDYDNIQPQDIQLFDNNGELIDMNGNESASQTASSNNEEKSDSEIDVEYAETPNSRSYRNDTSAEPAVLETPTEQEIQKQQAKIKNGTGKHSKGGAHHRQRL